MPRPRAAGPHFSEDFFAFFHELSTHNNREWFAANKARYERSVLEPSVRFVADAGRRLTTISRYISADARPYGGSISRIYRDIRFSKDKSPYKTHVNMHFHHARADESTHGGPGFYLFIEPGESFLASGIWQPDPRALKKVRDAIRARPQAWRRVRKMTPDLEGEVSRRPPPGYDREHPLIGDISRKEFIASVSFRQDRVVKPEFLDDVVRGSRELSPLNRFLSSAVGLPW